MRGGGRRPGPRGTSCTGGRRDGAAGGDTDAVKSFGDREAEEGGKKQQAAESGEKAGGPARGGQRLRALRRGTAALTRRTPMGGSGDPFQGFCGLRGGDAPSPPQPCPGLPLPARGGGSGSGPPRCLPAAAPAPPSLGDAAAKMAAGAQ